jgi:hypothetical protein
MLYRFGRWKTAMQANSLSDYQPKSAKISQNGMISE